MLGYACGKHKTSIKYDASSGIEEAGHFISVNIFPNPFSQSVLILIPSAFF